MTQTHVFYTGFTIASQVASWVVIITCSIQLYRDRSKLSELFIAPRKFKTMRVFRVTAFLGSVLYAVLSIDLFGAAGIYPATLRVLLFALFLLLFIAALSTGISNEVAVAISFFPVDHQKWKRRMQILVRGSLFADLVFLLLSILVDNRTVYIVSRAILLWTGVLLMVMIDGVYFLLRYHLRKATIGGMTTQGHNKWKKMLWVWRLYSAGLTICLGITCVLLIYDAVLSTARGTTRLNVIYVEDYEKTPDIAAIILPLAVAAMYLVFAWRSFIFQASGRTSATGSSGGGGTQQSKQLGGTSSLGTQKLSSLSTSDDVNKSSVYLDSKLAHSPQATTDTYGFVMPHSQRTEPV